MVISKVTRKIKKPNLGLKEDLKNHWLGDSKLSLKVRLKDQDNYLLGMNDFYLHKLRSRQYPYDYLFSDLLKGLNFPFVEHRIVKLI